jgi:hypothetical protein
MKTKQLLKIAMMLATVFAAANVNAQSTASPDSVCAGASGKSYKVVGTSGSSFVWSISGGGTVASGQNSDSITVNWSSTPGVDTLTVTEYNVIGCPGDPIQLAVLRLAPPTVVFSGTDSICINSATVLSKLQMNFTGVGPWTIGYTEAGTARSVTTSANPYNFNSQTFTSAGVKSYVPTSITDKLNCSGTGSGTGSVTVISKPSTSAIRHF